jgi:phage terminase large subunit-like protein
VTLGIHEKLELLELLEIQDRRKREFKLPAYKPYAKQREFHNASAEYRERLFMAGTQLGKTVAGANEIAMHLTGRYPDWWQGRRFKRPIRCMAGSETAELTKKGIQRLLLGEPEKREEWGTGAIPKVDLVRHTAMQGTPDAVASITVKCQYGGESTIQFSSYAQGREKWQADTLDIVWFDEEPGMDVYSEGLTRTNATGGMVILTFTPLLGMSNVVKRFLMEKPAGSNVTRMTIEDAEHYTPEERARIIATYPEHEREARARGIPIMGSGLVFPIAESVISVPAFPIPAHWGRINAWDFGWAHRAAWVALAHDRDSDTVYVYDCWAAKETPVMQQAGVVLAKGMQNIPHAWPHDGLQHDKTSGDQLAPHYKKFGINMLAERAQFEMKPDGKYGGNSVEAGLSMMLTRMQSHQFKVFSHLSDWFEEMRMYHRKDGVVVKQDDDIMSATRYGLMMLRKAKSLHEIGTTNRWAAPAANVPVFEAFDQAAGY